MKIVSPVYGTRFTPREKEVLSYIAQGFTSRQIARRLSISENTVANHRTKMLAKAGAHSSAELVEKNLKNYFN